MRGASSRCCPADGGEDTWFRDWAQTHPPPWTEARRAPGARRDDPDQVLAVLPGPAPSAEGYRIIWVHSNGKAARDAAARPPGSRRAPPPSTPAGATERPQDPPQDQRRRRTGHRRALQSAGADRWVGATTQPDVAEPPAGEPRPPRRGDPLPANQKTVSTATAAVDTAKVGYDAATDGCFPLITNDTAMTDAEALAAYRYQPNLERRHHLLKGAQDAAPLHLETRHRIEALLLCQFLAMLAGALIEREIRTAMAAAA